MKFFEIREKIKNLGDFKSVKEIRKAGLRIVKTKVGNYWLIEEEFLKPVIKSPRECKSILIKQEDLKYKVFMCHKSKKELKGTKAVEYIKWGEEQKFHKRPTCASRENWWELGKVEISQVLCMMSYNDRHIFWKNEQSLVDARFYDIYSEIKRDEIIISLNSTFSFLSVELNGRANLGEGALDFKVYEAGDINIINPEFLNTFENKINNTFQNFINREIKNIFQELGFDKNRPVREQQPNPLPDRKALDDIVFDILNLTEEERKEVYWAVAELVQNRLQKAKSV